MAKQSMPEIYAALRNAYAERRTDISGKWSRIKEAKARAHKLPNLPLTDVQQSWWKALDGIEDNYMMLLELREKYDAALMLLADMAIDAYDREAFKEAANTFLTEVGAEYRLSADVEMSVVESIDLLRRLVLIHQG